MAGVLSAVVLATRMQRDVDQMEAIWALAHLDPRVGSIMGVGGAVPQGGSVAAAMNVASIAQARREP
ncbi:hypothetical protein [Microvirga yunnanensis]|uniref:hypothetical protein n=1 Tax=Microvirga yunnanensis TaxID=2953740 RepID=UPI0021C6C956|nr:hypothetical protein [Microvirga sp. HBU65207]